MKKAEARDIISGMGLPEPQAQAARRTIGRATATEDIEIVAGQAGELLIWRQRPGKFGKQVFEDTISPSGSKVVVQKAYDAAGNLVHIDPKGGSA